MPEEPTFLTLAEVLELHRDMIATYGGSDGVRDLGMIESAVAQPRATFDGSYLYADLYEMAAALAYSLAMNHGFIDGNKRVAYAAALLFLEFNEADTDRIDPADFFEIVLGVASGNLPRDVIAEFLREQLA